MLPIYHLFGFLYEANKEDLKNSRELVKSPSCPENSICNNHLQYTIIRSQIIVKIKE